jgi:hypothetical protein
VLECVQLGKVYLERVRFGAGYIRNMGRKGSETERDSDVLYNFFFFFGCVSTAVA